MPDDSLQEAIFNPFATEEITPASSSEWAARRRAAEASRRLTEALVSSAPDAATLADIADRLDECSDRLEATPRLYGIKAFAVDGGHGSYGEINHELNAVAGYSNPLSPGLNMWIEGDRAYGTVTCGQAYEGPPGCIHGGYIAAIFDQFLGMAQLAAKQPGMTGTLNIRYHRPTPLNQALALSAHVEAVGTRKTRVRGEITVNGRVTATAEGLFVRPKEGKIAP
jgi:hypothetical protein